MKISVSAWAGMNTLNKKEWKSWQLQKLHVGFVSSWMDLTGCWIAFQVSKEKGKFWRQNLKQVRNSETNKKEKISCEVYIIWKVSYGSNNGLCILGLIRHPA